jgi:hypothetical protein
MHRRIAHACVLASALIAIALPAYAEDALGIISAREKSMGGRHVALADDSSVLLANPAGLADLPTLYSAADVSFQAIGPLFDIADLFTKSASASSSSAVSSIASLLADNDYKLYAGADIAGPLATGFSGDGLGFGLYNRTKAILNVASVSSIAIDSSETVLLAGGYAVHFDLGNENVLQAGVGAKGFVIGSLSPSLGLVEALSVVSDPSSLLSSSAMDLTTGVGVDLGLRWVWKNTYAAGLVYRDAYSPAILSEYSSLNGFLKDSATAQVSSSYTTLPSSLDVGFAWTPELGALSKIFDNFVFAADYRDILDLFAAIPRNPVLNLGLGCEAKVLDIVRFRAGISDALLSAGLGLDLSVFAVNISVFGTELGLDPGDRTCYNLAIDFAFKY